MKKWVKNNKKIFVVFVCLLLVGVTSVSAAAVTIFASGEVSYDNSKSGMDSDNVQDAIDELYKEATAGKVTPTSISSVLGSVDATETSRYIYKGANPNNYIKFNGNELWRIYSIESDGSIKIVKDESIGNMQFDPGYANELSGVSSANSIVGTRYSSTSGDYCQYNSSNENKYYGCNPWGSKTTTLDSSGTVTTKQSREAGKTSTTYTLPESESYLNVYLNHQFNSAVYKGLNSAKTGYETINLPSYYNIDSTSKAYIKTATWNIGSPGYAYWSNSVFYGSETSIKDMESYEEYYKWTGKVGLLTATEYMRANSSTSANCSTFKALQPNAATCKTTNYLHKSGYHQWLLSPGSGDADYVLHAHNAGSVNGAYTRGTSYGVRPAVYLCSGLTLSGSGTSAKPYTISGSCS